MEAHLSRGASLGTQPSQVLPFILIRYRRVVSDIGVTHFALGVLRLMGWRASGWRTNLQDSGLELCKAGYSIGLHARVKYHTTCRPPLPFMDVPCIAQVAMCQELNSTLNLSIKRSYISGRNYMKTCLSSWHMVRSTEASLYGYVVKVMQFHKFCSTRGSIQL